MYLQDMTIVSVSNIVCISKNRVNHFNDCIVFHDTFEI